MSKDYESPEEPEAATARQLEHKRRNEMQSELIRQELERIRRSRHSSTAIRRGIGGPTKGPGATTDR
jgi:hypothetical protein